MDGCAPAEAFVEFKFARQSATAATGAWLKLCLMRSKEEHLYQAVTRIRTLRERFLWMLYRRSCRCVGPLQFVIIVFVHDMAVLQQCSVEDGDFVFGRTAFD